MKFESGVVSRRAVRVLLAAALPLLAAFPRAAPAKDRPNVLFIAADDLRPCWAATASRPLRPPASTGWPPGGPPSAVPTARLPNAVPRGCP